MDDSSSLSDKQQLKISWHAISAEEAVARLETPLERGLSSEEAQQRLNTYGANRLAEKARATFLQMVFAQFNNFIVILLIIAAIISALLGDMIEAAAIMAIVILNAVLGVIQERNAEQALAALRKLSAPEALVLRDGHRQSIPSYNLVPGDVVYLEAGNFVPADLRLLESVNLRIEEAALTGESVPVQKNTHITAAENVPLGDRKNTAFMGTTVNYGRGRGIVIATGMHTQLGLIANMLQNVDEGDTPLQQRLDHLGKLLGYGALAVCALVFVVGLLRATQIDLSVITNMFMVAISLAIAAVPEGLPAVVTISLAMGMREMVRRHALIRRLASVETLGSATVICSDKTGTLTQNAMTVTRLWAGDRLYEVGGSGYDASGDFFNQGQKIEPAEHPALLNALWVGLLNNDAQLEAVMEDERIGSYRIIGDPTEASLLVAAAKAGAFSSELNEAYPRVNEVPFDSTRKRMITLHAVLKPQVDDISPVYDENGKKQYAIVVKGAPDVVLSLCNRYRAGDNQKEPLDETKRREILAVNDDLTAQALRVLGMAYRLVPELPQQISPELLEDNLIFAGLAGMIDPARDEVKPALSRAMGAGIRTIMITGDFANTARAIAEGIGLLRPGHRVSTGAELDQLDERQLNEVVKTTDVFARVSPEHKMRIVDALRANGEIVAMTGDGVNDAPAIKRADIGIAMGITGTDVAKETADMVLTDDHYASIVSAIEQGRVIYSNIRKFVYYLLSCNMAEIMIIFIATLITGISPLTAIQLLWLNLVTDGAPALALATEKGDPDIMHHAPRPPKEPIINRFMTAGIIVQTIAITAATLAAYFIGRSLGEEHLAQTMAFATLSLSELLRAYTARSEYYPLLKIGVFANRWMNLAVLSSVALILLVIYAPFLNTIFKTDALNGLHWSIVLPLLIVPSLAAELTKLVYGWMQRTTQQPEN
ncbi:MAG: cation-translocating P-type ATPase [Anaerolineae bacterium]|nr:cation-translocating P-type ATPase [Anaerolineae bacterium]